MLHISNKLQRSRSRSLSSKKVFSRTGKLSKTIMVLRQHPKEIIWNRFFVFFLGRCCDSILLNPLKKSVVVLRQHYWKHYIEQVFVLFWAVSVCVCVCGVFLCVCVCDFMCCDSIYWTKHLKKSGVPCGRSIRHSMMAGARRKAERDGEKLPGHTAWAPD